MLKLDAIGEACPAPIIMAKKALKENDSVMVLVNDEIATQNLNKLAEKQKLSISVDKVNDTDFEVTLIKKENSNSEATQKIVINDDSYIVVINTNVMGHGDDKLGDALLHGFVNSLTEQDVLPDAVVCYNGGVKLLANGSDYVADLKTLEENGVNIYGCGACLDYYNLKDDIALGEITNMYSIVEMMREANRVVRPD